jgi:hypothetical protein
VTKRAGNKIRPGVLVAACVLALAMRAHPQNRGVYPLGMSATNSGVTPGAGFTYVNQLLYYSRDHAKDDAGNTLPVTGENYVLMDMNTFVWVSEKKLLGGAAFSAVATLPFAKNDLTSDVQGNISGGGGFADSYYMPCILGWNRDRVAVRAIYGFLAPTGRFAAGASNNVGSGYWTHALSSGQTFYLESNKRVVLSAFQMYEFHTTQENTGIHPGQTFDLDYSLMGSIPGLQKSPLQIGLIGYEARQTTARTGPAITPAQEDERYRINAIGFASSVAFPSRKASLGVKFFDEFADRSTYQGFSLQLSGSISF